MYCLCLHDNMLNKIKNVDYVPVGLGNGKFSEGWLKDDTLNNISFKNKYYGEYTFHYWFWKNVFPKIEDNHWIGFCAYRKLWGNKKKISQKPKFEDAILKEVPAEWEKFDTIVGEHIYVNDLKLSKLVKHGLWSLVRNPSALFKSKRNLRFQFDMWHGNGNLDRAIDLLDDSEREDFRMYTKQNISFSRGNMFVCRSKKIINNYYTSIFPWLKRCEKIFGFDLKGYGQTRMYTFLAERYLSYWFDKYTKPLLWPVIFYDISK